MLASKKRLATYEAAIKAGMSDYEARELAWPDKPNRLRRFFHRPPDVVLGELTNPYMLRWWVIPRNPYLNIYLHKFLRSDDDRALHDHPWASMSILLSGQYNEEMPADPQKWVEEGDRRTVKKLRQPFRPIRRGANAIHRVELLPVVEKQQAWRWEGNCPSIQVPYEKEVLTGLQPTWSLFITGPWRRGWGFWCPKGWRPWREFLAERERGHNSVVGRGCE